MNRRAGGTEVYWLPLYGVLLQRTDLESKTNPPTALYTVKQKLRWVRQLLRVYVASK